tara:strand:+ start:1329 stop:1619 length:291 start_codon:yes stop_codon:yes gene_type:complete
MDNKVINYQQIYEDELSTATRDSLELPDRFHDMSHQNRRMVEELIDIGYKRALKEALDPEVLEATAELASEMGAQLYNFANMLGEHLADQNKGEEE